MLHVISSAKTSGKSAGNPWSSPVGPKSGRTHVSGSAGGLGEICTGRAALARSAESQSQAEAGLCYGRSPVAGGICIWASETNLANQSRTNTHSFTIQYQFYKAPLYKS